MSQTVTKKKDSNICGEGSKSVKNIEDKDSWIEVDSSDSSDSSDSPYIPQNTPPSSAAILPQDSPKNKNPFLPIDTDTLKPTVKVQPGKKELKEEGCKKWRKRKSEDEDEPNSKGLRYSSEPQK